jgi:transposase InsO family protein
MATKDKIALRKLNLLELAKALKNVSLACKHMGYSRQQFYEIRRNFQVYGSDGLIDRLPGARGPHPNRVSADHEKAILAFSLEEPTAGCMRVAQELQLKGIQVSSMGIRGVWSRHNLLSKHDRLLRLEEAVRAKRIQITPEQIQLLERFSPEFRDRHIEVHHTGELVAVDTFMVGSLKGVGRIYLQSAIDCYSRHAWGRLFTNKMPVTAVHLLNHDVLPFFEKHHVAIETVLSDNGREYCGKPESHPYELFLQMEDIEHRTTKVRRPQSNGMIERLHRTLLDEHFRIKGRQKWYESVIEMQKDLDQYFKKYNNERPHQGRNMNGSTPYNKFKEGIKKTEKQIKKAA